MTQPLTKGSGGKRINSFIDACGCSYTWRGDFDMGREKVLDKLCEEHERRSEYERRVTPVIAGAPMMQVDLRSAQRRQE